MVRQAFEHPEFTEGHERVENRSPQAFAVSAWAAMRFANVPFARANSS